MVDPPNKVDVTVLISAARGRAFVEITTCFQFVSALQCLTESTSEDLDLLVLMTLLE